MDRTDETSSASLNISLPTDLKLFVEDHVSTQGYTSVSEFIRSLIREKRAEILRITRQESRLIEAIGTTTRAEQQLKLSKLHEALDLMRFSHKLLESNLRREEPRANDEQIKKGLITWNSASNLSEEVPGHIASSSTRLKRLLRGKS